jgi:hypothetical protein
MPASLPPQIPRLVTPEAAPVLDLSEHASLLRRLPKPSPDQMANFARYVATAHSWYKHLPWYPPGVPFHVFVDPAAGMQRVMSSDGTVTAEPRHRRGWHYSWAATGEYRALYGHLAFAQANGTSVNTIRNSGDIAFASDGRPTIFDDVRGEVFGIPSRLLEAGTAFASGIIHDIGADLTFLKIYLLRFLPGGYRAPDSALNTTAPQSTPDPITERLRRALNDPNIFTPWPEESGGSPQLVAILERCLTLLEDPTATEPTGLGDRGASPYPSPPQDRVLYALLAPERTRQRQGLVDACQRAVDLIWNTDAV